MNIADLLSEHESPRLEFKERFPSNEKLAALFCAFANTAGGDLVIGVEDGTRRVLGVAETDILDMEEKIAAISSTSVSPMVFPLVRVHRCGDVPLMHVRIDAGFQKPYRVSAGAQAGKAYVRIGSTTRQADRATEQAMSLRSHGLSWDSLPCIDGTLADLDRSLLEEFVDLRHKRRGIPIPAKLDTAWMEKVRLASAHNGVVKPTNGAILLFAQSPQEYFPSTALEMARFQGTTGRDFIDKQSISGPLWKQYDKALMFLQRHVSSAAARSDSARVETSSYPSIAFREFAVNALCHRSYEHQTGSIRCAIFDDAIQITNPGTLPDGLNLDDVGCGVSVIRNPIIARVFNEIGLIEAWGTGIQVAQQELAKHNLPPARIELKGFFLQVTSPWRWPNTLAKNEVAIVRTAASHGDITSEEVAASLKVTDRAARKILSALVSREVLVKVGSTKGTVYRLR